MTAIYLISKLLTFPGAFLKAFWEHCLLKLMKIPVEDTAYLQLNELFGHVEHEMFTKRSRCMIFCLVPGLVNFLLAAPLLFTSSIQLFYLGIEPRDIETGLVVPLFFVCILMYWIGMSLLCCSAPLYEDALHLYDSFYGAEKAGIAARILLFIPTIFIFAASFLERFGLNIILAAAATAALIFC